MTGAAQVSAPVAAVPDAGILVTAFVPGTPLLAALTGAAAPDRAALVARAADWLARYVAPSLAARKRNTGPWIASAARAAARQPHPDLAEAEAAILAHMRHLAGDEGWARWRAAISHGDFHPANLIADGATLTGVDTGGSARMPLCKDIARFLTHLARRGITLGPGTRLGVDAVALDIFAERLGLSAREQARDLPFFLGFEMLIRVERPDMPKWRMALARRMAAGYLADA
jgi:hypothetical protein